MVVQALTVKERNLLELLARNQHRIVRYEEIAALWHDDYAGAATVIRTYMVRLRRKGVEITNHAGVGYRLGNWATCNSCNGLGFKAITHRESNSAGAVEHSTSGASLEEAKIATPELENGYLSASAPSIAAKSGGLT